MKYTGGPRVNEAINVPRLKVISSEGEILGVLARADALYAARQSGLDLVMVSEPDADGVATARIMDFGKALYAKKKKIAEARKKQKVIKIKEIKIRPKIGEHDYQIKLRQAAQFLRDGNRVKMTLVFRGREIAMKGERGSQLFGKIDQDFTAQELIVAYEGESRLGQYWSRVYYLKH